MEAEQEHRVQVASKKQVTEQVEKYKAVLRAAADGQAAASEDSRRRLVAELLANFEAAVQVNVLVKGLPWEEAPDDEVEDEAVDLESLLDETIVETTRRRSTYPKRILPHVVHALKAERRMMGLYEQAVKPQELLQDPHQESTMQDLSAAAPALVKQAIQVIKSINALQRQAEGLCQVLSMTPSQASLDVHREVFPPAEDKRPVRRAAGRASAAEGYEPLAKKPASAGASAGGTAAAPQDDTACSEDEGRRMRRREKNRVAAQKSRKRQTQRADLLHEACELLEQRNRKLRREVDSLSEEQRLLTEALTAHEPLCPIMHCAFTSAPAQLLNA